MNDGYCKLHGRFFIMMRMARTVRAMVIGHGPTMGTTMTTTMVVQLERHSSAVIQVHAAAAAAAGLQHGPTVPIRTMFSLDASTLVGTRSMRGFFPDASMSAGHRHKLQQELRRRGSRDGVEEMSEEGEASMSSMTTIGGLDCAAFSGAGADQDGRGGKGEG